ncbi:hypothetical protein [Methylobacterium sp. J-077]|uniref:hypothetical protein n=1 Tax=Methylobacterium sp. J-077 TaxID=2836656 RepID=UPI001FB890E8|nr:hypothetical protein [Methylobacterium sp. J-077]MCJ2121630.1 hypothetical protein [Methylobacterium sp. J-077]
MHSDLKCRSGENAQTPKGDIMTHEKIDDATDNTADPFSDAHRRTRQAGQIRRDTLRRQISETHPEVLAEFDREQAKFTHITDTAIQPVLLQISADLQAQGWYARIIREDEAEGIVGLATAGIRLLFSRDPLPEPAIIDLFGETSFIGFHGDCPNRVVRMRAEFYQDRTTSGNKHSEVTLTYSDLTVGIVYDIVTDFLKGIG